MRLQNHKQALQWVFREAEMMQGAYDPEEIGERRDEIQELLKYTLRRLERLEVLETAERARVLADLESMGTDNFRKEVKSNG